MNDEKYTTRLSMVMPESDRGMLQALAVKLGLTESDVIRHYIRQHYAEHFGRADSAAASQRELAEGVRVLAGLREMPVAGLSAARSGMAWQGVHPRPGTGPRLELGFVRIMRGRSEPGRAPRPSPKVQTVARWLVAVLTHPDFGGRGCMISRARRPPPARRPQLVQRRRVAWS